MSSLWRPILEALMKRPGQLYQPVYFGHLADGEALTGEVVKVAKGHGVDVFMSLGEWQGKGGEPGIVLINEDELGMAKDHKTKPGVQFIGFGQDVGGQPAEVRSWLEKGLVVPSLAETVHLDLGDSDLEGLIQQLEQVENSLCILVTEEDKTVSITQELRIRLEAANFEVALAGGGAGGLGATLQDKEGPARQVTIMRGGGSFDVADIFRLIDAKAQGGQLARLMVVIGQATWKELSKKAEWTALSKEAETFRLDTLSALKEEEEQKLWPELSEILDSLPSFPPRPSMATTGWTEWKSNGEIELFSYMQSGPMLDITVYYSEGAARIRIRNRQVVDIEMTGDRWTVDKLKIIRERAGRVDSTTEDCRYDLINDRIRRIVQWPRAKVVVAKTEAGGRDVPKKGVAVQGLILDVATWIDQRKNAINHTLSTKWKAIGKPKWPEPNSVSQKVWEVADGQKTAWQIDEELGVGRETILHTLGMLAEATLLERTGDGDGVPETISVGAISQAMLISGLDQEAKAYLSEQLGQEDLGAPEKALLSALIAISDGPRQALRLMEEAVAESGKNYWLPRRMDLAILLIRSGKKAGRVWRELQRDMSGQPEYMGKSWTIRQYAKWGEMAIRNKDWTTGKSVVSALEQAGEPGEPLASKLNSRIESR